MAAELTEGQRRILPISAVTLASLDRPNLAPFAGFPKGCMPAMKLRRLAGKAAMPTPLKPHPDFLTFDVGWC